MYQGERCMDLGIYTKLKAIEAGARWESTKLRGRPKVGCGLQGNDGDEGQNDDERRQGLMGDQDA